MNDHVYNTAEVLAVLNQIVASKPEGYRYADDPDTRYMSQVYGLSVDKTDQYSTTWCEYFRPDGKPACIIGHVLDRLAIKLPNEYNDTPFNQVVDIYPPLADLFTDEAVEVLYQTQYKQDMGAAWNVAVEYGRTYAR